MPATPEELRELQAWRRHCALPLRAGTPDAPPATPQEVYQRVLAAELRAGDLKRANAALADALEELIGEIDANPASLTVCPGGDPRLVFARAALAQARRAGEGS